MQRQRSKLGGAYIAQKREHLFMWGELTAADARSTISNKSRYHAAARRDPTTHAEPKIAPVAIAAVTRRETRSHAAAAPLIRGVAAAFLRSGEVYETYQ